MTSQLERWRSIGRALGIEVISPFTITLAGDSVTFVAMLPQFGGSAGIVADPDSSVIAPYWDALIDAGYGFSCITVGDDPERMREVLLDWTWTSKSPKPDWL